jgi:hypothetical protein
MPRSLNVFAIRFRAPALLLPFENLQPDRHFCHVLRHDPYVTASQLDRFSARQFLENLACGIDQDTNEAERCIATNAIAALR